MEGDRLMDTLFRLDRPNTHVTYLNSILLRLEFLVGIEFLVNIPVRCNEAKRAGLEKSLRCHKAVAMQAPHRTARSKVLSPNSYATLRIAGISCRPRALSWHSLTSINALDHKRAIAEPPNMLPQQFLCSLLSAQLLLYIYYLGLLTWASPRAAALNLRPPITAPPVFPRHAPPQ